MQLIVTGATGFVGRNLIPALLNKKYQVTAVGRNTNKISAIFKNNVSAISWDELALKSPEEFTAVINLAGENIAQHYWTYKWKKIIIDSRVDATKQIVDWCLKAKNQKPHLYNASAIGIYGLQEISDNQTPKPLTENTPIPFGHATDFLSEVGQAWENAAKPADDNIPTTLMRFAVILKRGEGMLKKLALPFQLGLGSVLGTGQQSVSWIQIDDLISAIIFLLEHPEIVGPVNISAPECVSQRTFAKTLADAMGRPLFLTMPAFMVNTMFGQMGKELLLGGQNIYPERLKQLGFEFLYPDLSSALSHEIKNP